MLRYKNENMYRSETAHKILSILNYTVWHSHIYRLFVDMYTMKTKYVFIVMGLFARKDRFAFSYA